jgi:two-component system, LuxR family, sensor kinase FixL
MDQGGQDILDHVVGDNYLAPWQQAANGGDSDATRALAGIDSVLRGAAATFRLEYSRRTPNGNRWFVLQAQRLQRPGGGAVIGHFDRSQRQKSALELQEARQELLRAAQTAAAGELVGAIGHDLRQPLSSIRMNAQASLSIMQRDGVQSQDLSDALRDILEENDRAAEILRVARDLLAHHQPMRDAVDLNALCLDVQRLVASEAAARGVPMRLELDDTLPPVSGDPRQLRQALLSMLLNALEMSFKSGAPGQGIVIATRSSERGRVDVSVSDRAPRPAADAAAKQAAVTDARGLALVRAVAEAHYGYVLTDDGTSGSVVRMVVPVSFEPAKEGV